jgi:hypothetical protein
MEFSPKFIANFVGRSQQTLRRYMSEPGTRSAMKPPIVVTDRMVTLINMATSAKLDLTVDEWRLMCEWTDIINSDNISDVILADIAGVSRRHLAWVGRSHPSFGIQPTDDMVAHARATEALMQAAAA